MSKFTEAAQSVRNAAQQFKAFSDAAEILDAIGSVENAADEANLRLADVGSKINASLEKHRILLEHSKDVDRDIANRIAGAELNADAIESDGRAAAAKIIEDAKALADSLVSKAAANVAKIEAGNTDLLAERAVLEAQLQDTRSKAIDIHAEADAAQAKLDAVNAQIAKLSGVSSQLQHQ